MLTEIKKQLIDNPTHIQNILEKYEFCHITIKSNELRCGVEQDSNKTSVRIKLQNNDFLYVSDYGRGLNCDFISYIIQSRHVEFKEVINAIKHELGIDHYLTSSRKTVFGGFYDKIKVRKTSMIDLKTYDDSILEPYLNKLNTRFLADGISLTTQKKFKIGFDINTQRITCPWWSFDGQLVGITGRYNGDYETDEVIKWFPIIPHPKSQTLYGFTENYQYLQGCDELFIGESEKFSMQLDSMDIYTGLALGGNTIHAPQIKHIINLMPKKIIFCFDEGLDTEVILAQIQKVKSMTKFFDIQVGYIDNTILPEGSKVSPSDLGKEKFIELKNNYVKWVI